MTQNSEFDNTVAKKTDSIYGLVLAGGKSSRMGEDKGLLQFYDKPQREHVFGLLKLFCEEVFTSCRASQQVPPAFHPIQDFFDLDSPLNGILSAFRLHPQVTWLTVPVDMPNIDRAAIAFLLMHRDKTKVATCLYDSDEKLPEPLFVLWESQAFTLLKKYFDGGGHSPREFLLQYPLNILTAPDNRTLININVKEEWNNWLRRSGQT